MDCEDLFIFYHIISLVGAPPVSYTHLDVYKRQEMAPAAYVTVLILSSHLEVWQ